MKRKQCTFKLSFIERSFIWLVAVYFVASIITGLTSCSKSGHSCPYSGCPFKGQEQFKTGCGYCEQGSDCWALDSIHFEHPADTYEQNEEILFSNK